jgi:uncharacterized protein
MIREGKKIPSDVKENIPVIVEKLSPDREITALYVFGSLAKNVLKPLSDLDFGILLSGKLTKSKRFDKHLYLIGIFCDTFHTDEIDIVVMNDSPIHFCYNIIRSGKLLLVNNKKELIDFHELVVKKYLDFSYYQNEFDDAFLKGIGYK